MAAVACAQAVAASQAKIEAVVDARARELGSRAAECAAEANREVRARARYIIPPYPDIRIRCADPLTKLMSEIRYISIRTRHRHPSDSGPSQDVDLAPTHPPRLYLKRCPLYLGYISLPLISQSVRQSLPTPTTGHRLTRSRPSPDERAVLSSRSLYRRVRRSDSRGTWQDYASILPRVKGTSPCATRRRARRTDSSPISPRIVRRRMHRQSAAPRSRLRRRLEIRALVQRLAAPFCTMRMR